MVDPLILPIARPDTLDYRVTAWGTTEANPEELVKHRRSLPASYPTISRGSWKHFDPQTVACLAALLEARSHLHEATDLSKWGIVGAPREPGLELFSRQHKAFLRDGAWAVSWHLIQQHSLHSIPGIISQTLKCHGPNLGVGGLPGSEGDALLVASALLQDSQVPGCWVVWSGWDTEADEVYCRAVVLGLVPASSALGNIGSPGIRLSIAAGVELDQPKREPLQLQTLYHALTRKTGTMAWSLAPLGRVTLNMPEVQDRQAA